MYMHIYVVMVAVYIAVHIMNITNVGLSEKNTSHDKKI